MKVAIYGRRIKIKQFETLFKALLDCLNSKNVSFAVIDSYQEFLDSQYNIRCDACSPEELRNEPFDALISLGGDGTMLDTLTIVRSSGIPVLGINLGRLGFLASILMEQVDEAINALINNDYQVEKRSLLKVVSPLKTVQEFPYALNDFVVQKRDTSAMITVKTSLNGAYLNNYWADGLIVATPTGSSGYSMSCGGPLLFPGSQSFVITPIAAHNLTVRPAVIPDSNTLSVSVKSRADNVLVTLDSRSFKMSSKTKIEVTKADFTFNMIRLKGNSYMDTIRNKLLWGKDIRD